MNDFRKREHVIPQCFGLFQPDNLILRNVVCDECNQYFGDNIELFWARDSFEGLERLRHGISPKKEIQKRIRVSNTVIEGEYKNAKVDIKLDKQTKQLYADFVVQVGIYNKTTEEYFFYESGNLPTAQELNTNLEISQEKPVIILGQDENIDTILKELKDKGINIEVEDNIAVDHMENIHIETNTILDRTIMRGLCKVSFNYLAFNLPKEIILKKNFDDIRDFIRNNKGRNQDFIFPNQKPILYYDNILRRHNLKTTTGHLITLKWDNYNTLSSKLSFFNTMTYKIILTKNYHGIFFPLRVGHHFDIETGNVNTVG